MDRGEGKRPRGRNPRGRKEIKSQWETQGEKHPQTSHRGGMSGSQRRARAECRLWLVMEHNQRTPALSDGPFLWGGEVGGHGGQPHPCSPRRTTPSLGKPVPDEPGSKEPRARLTEGRQEPGQGPGRGSQPERATVSVFLRLLTWSSKSHIPGRPSVRQTAVGRSTGMPSGAPSPGLLKPCYA